MNENATDILFAEERKEAIVKLVNERKKVLVPELIDYFKMSPATIRNDLRDLEAAGLIKRTHGGAIPSSAIRVGFEMDSNSKNVELVPAKEAIARKAVEWVEEGDIIVLDTGTTTLEMAKRLLHKKNVTVIVNDIEIASVLEKFEGVNVVIIGGTLRRNFHCTVGPFAVKLLSELNVDKVFLGTNAFSAEKGCTTPDINQAEIKKTMVQIATQVIVLCDSSKIGKNSFVQFAPPSDIDALVTDDNVDSALLKEISETGIDVHLAEVAK
ncbi:DeoR/GlpR family DNA-binding transcription regulator [Cohnella cellulosilytica]|uniref:DeoR/GlpR family DNA-binding transcription regulator n=1 Tax=Cohnella cellulosilytica TaxID=986710 RepID=A0ABW2FR20_9BACL